MPEQHPDICLPSADDLDARITGWVVYGVAVPWFDPGHPGSVYVMGGGVEEHFERDAFGPVPARAGVGLWVEHQTASTLARVHDGSLRVWNGRAGLMFAATLPVSGPGFEVLRAIRQHGRLAVSVGFRSATPTRSVDGRRVRAVAAAELLEISLARRGAYAGAVALAAALPGVGPWPDDLAAVVEAEAEMTSWAAGAQ